MPLQFTTARTDDDLHQILYLQTQNHKSLVSDIVKREQGFVTVRHTWQELSKMHEATPQIIAKDEGKVVAYALAMLPDAATLIPDLQPMFALFEQISWQNKKLADCHYYVMGQVCVAESHRGQGLFDGLYEQHRELYRPNFDLLITEVSAGNGRSLRAHERVGFRPIHTHIDHVDTWQVLAWAF
ncbi:N-acetyltransferase family protein [Persicitalea sp.]|uniref:GNAT family N-acetyltransferase n=1 Tax=Persicitalea sp. TaxID=3100273 RepID=UPI003593C8CA